MDYFMIHQLSFIKNRVSRKPYHFPSSIKISFCHSSSCFFSLYVSIIRREMKQASVERLRIIISTVFKATNSYFRHLKQKVPVAN